MTTVAHSIEKNPIDCNNSDASQSTCTADDPEKEIDHEASQYIEINPEANKVNITAFKQTPYPTEGIRNPGWLTVISCWLVNFFIFGTIFSWGDYQSL
jgi:hypothetical protein